MRNKDQVAYQSRLAIQNGVRLFQSHALGLNDYDHVYEMIRHFEIPANRRVLDVGSGTGFTGYVMGQIRKDLEFVNMNYIYEQIIRSSTPSILGDAHSLPFSNRSFGGALLIYTLGHLRPLDTFKEIWRILTQGAALYIYDIYLPDSDYEEELDYVFWLPEEICQFALQAGFEEVHFRLPSIYFTHRTRAFLGDEQFEKYFGRGRPILYQLTKP